MSYKKKRDNSLGCLGWFIEALIGLIIVISALSIGASKFGLNVNGLINGIVQLDVTQALDSIIKGNSNSPDSLSLSSRGSENTYQPLSYTGKKQLVLGGFDGLGRATFAHIQLKDDDEPNGVKRESKITYDPVGWHNYKLNYIDVDGETKQAFLMNRGHLIGYQFSGLNSEGRNLVPMTRLLNAGTVSDKAMDDSNPYSMLFYENQLDSWLSENPDKTLDLKVVPNYNGNELIPRTVTMNWSGYDSKGEPILVDLKTRGNEIYSGVTGNVTLENTSPNATIDYSTGQATQN